jgi:6-phosphogluconolactonase
VTPIVGRAILHADAVELARSAAEDFAALARKAVQERGHFAAALTGGSSPVALYRMLGQDDLASRIPWREVHLFWGDDRVVPPGHPRSNFGLAHRLFIQHVPIPAENLHRVHGELGARRAAKRYAEELASFFSAPASFDLIHLGLGDDGHIASLFPFDRRALLEREEPAVATLFRGLGEWRVTVTYPVLNAARRLEFLLPSEGKAAIAHTAMYGPIDPIRIPAQQVNPAGGELIWRVTRSLADLARSPSGPRR